MPRERWPFDTPVKLQMKLYVDCVCPDRPHDVVTAWLPTQEQLSKIKSASVSNGKPPTLELYHGEYL